MTDHDRPNTRRYARVAGLLSGLMLISVAAPAPAQPNLGELMQQKLERAQQLLEAVVLERFPAVERHAHHLLVISEDSTWTPMPTATFLNYAAAFQDAARDLEAAGRAREMDDASTAYMALVSTCVQCHRHVRGAKLARGP